MLIHVLPMLGVENFVKVLLSIVRNWLLSQSTSTTNIPMQCYTGNTSQNELRYTVSDSYTNNIPWLLADLQFS